MPDGSVNDCVSIGYISKRGCDSPDLNPIDYTFANFLRTSTKLCLLEP